MYTLNLIISALWKIVMAKKKYKSHKKFSPIWDRIGKTETEEEKYHRLRVQLSQLCKGLWENWNMAQREHMVLGMEILYEESDPKNKFQNWMKMSKLFFANEFKEKEETFTPMQYKEFFEKIIKQAGGDLHRYVHTPENKQKDEKKKLKSSDIRHRTFTWSEKEIFFEIMGYYPHDLQKQVHSCEARFMIVVAGTRGGKSYMTAHEALATFFLPDARIWLVGKQYDVADKEFDWIEERLLTWRIGDKSAAEFFGIKIHKPKFGSRSIRAPWGSYIETKSCKDPDTLLGVELDLIILCEPHHIAWKIWTQMLRGRLASRKGRALGAATGCGFSALMRKFVERGLDESEDWKDWFTLSFRSKDNPYFPEDEYEAARKELDSKIFEEQYAGKIVDVRGNVFYFEAENEFNIEDLKRPEDWSNFVAYIYKANNPSCAVVVAKHPKSKALYVVEELFFKTGVAISEHFYQIDEVIKGRYGNKKRIWTLGEDKLSRKIISDVGLFDMSDEDELSMGRSQLLKARVLAINDYFEKDKLFISRNCPYLKESLLKARWPEDKLEESGKENSEVPLSAYMTMPLALSTLVMWNESRNPCGTNYYYLGE